MAINILGLSAKEATLERPAQNQPVSYKLSAESAKEKLGQAKDKGEIRDLLELSGKTQEDIKRVSTGEVKRTGGYTLDAFFTKDMPKMTNENGNYVIGKEEFTQEELIQIRGVLKAATDGIGLGAGKNINLDYRDFQAMLKNIQLSMGYRSIDFTV